MGAIPISEDRVHQDAFIPCLTCNCDKSNLPPDKKCVDTVYDLTPVIEKLTSKKYEEENK
jgi:hypothetical protein